MIERVAQAIFAKDPEGLFTIHQARVYAKAAIEEMRVPHQELTDGILGATGDALGSLKLAQYIWQTMIDAALEEK